MATDTINIINFHITNRCNYHCTYCFGKFDGQPDCSIEDAKSIANNISDYFKTNNIEDGRINIAGGEPLCYPQLDELIEYINYLGIQVSIVTNGSLLTPERIKLWKGMVSMIGLSIDSANPDTNLKIGRCCKNVTLERAHWIELADAIHNCEITLKINTVVSKLNCNEDLNSLYFALQPQRLKLFQMHLVEGINNHAKPYEITDQMYIRFNERHKYCVDHMVPEPEQSMENSYLMINPRGVVQLNDKGEYHTYGDCINHSLIDIVQTLPLSFEKINIRYKEGE